MDMEVRDFDTRLGEGISGKKAQVLAGQFGLGVDEVKEIASGFDPTPNAQYATWIMKQIEAGGLVNPDDSSKCRETLGLYQRLVQGQANIDRDISSFATFNDLYDATERLSGFKSQKDVEKAQAEAGFRRLAEVDGFTIFEITTTEAAAKACRGTNWCVKRSPPGRDTRQGSTYRPPGRRPGRSRPSRGRRAR